MRRHRPRGLATLALAALAGCVSQAPPATGSPETEKLDRRGVQAAEQGDWRAAQAAFTQSVRGARARDNLWGVANGQLNLAELARREGRPDEARARLAQARVLIEQRLPPGDEGTRRLRGHLLLAEATLELEAGATGAAERLLGEAQAMYESLATGADHELGAVWSNRGALARARGQRDQARAHFERALALHAEHFDGGEAQTHQAEAAAAHVQLALLAQEAGDSADARAHFQAALELDRAADHLLGVADDLRFLAELEARDRHFDEALDYYHRAFYVNASLDRFAAADDDLRALRALALSGARAEFLADLDADLEAYRQRKQARAARAPSAEPVPSVSRDSGQAAAPAESAPDAADAPIPPGAATAQPNVPPLPLGGVGAPTGQGEGSGGGSGVPPLRPPPSAAAEPLVEPAPDAEPGAPR